MDQICAKAQSQGCRIWVDSEQHAVQTSIDAWTIPFMRKYNSNNSTPLVYNTLQAYLKSSRLKLQSQLTLAQKENWTLAIKLVRGAYIDSDPRERIWETKEETDASYNSIVHDLLSGSNLGVPPEKMPQVRLFLAGHNPFSVSTAIDLMQSLSASGTLKTTPEFGQLQGMADELGCKILNRADELRGQSGKAAVPLVYKCLTWGSVQECMQYLLRRAIENSGGTDRMRDGYRAYAREVRRRVRRVVGKVGWYCWCGCMGWFMDRGLDELTMIMILLQVGSLNDWSFLERASCIDVNDHFPTHFHLTVLSFHWYD